MEKKCKIIYLNNFIYILSDDEIKEGDWFIGDNTSVKQCTLNNAGNINFKGGWYSGSSNCKKIIATTDTSLKLSCSCLGMRDKVSCNWMCKTHYSYTLPQPSQQFIQKYIESFNKGEVITDVLIEYAHYEMSSKANYRGNYDFTCLNCKDSKDDLWYSSTPTYCDNCNYLKINPKDNTITIKKLKNNWNREEVVKMFKTFDKHVKQYNHYFEGIDKWIKENL